MKKMILKIYYKFLNVKDSIIVIYNKLIVSKKKRPLVKTTNETLDKIIANNHSVSRFGDGEFGIMSGKSIIFQQYSKELCKRLNEIIKSNNSNCLICIPNVFDDMDWCEEKPRKYWEHYLNLNINKIYKMIDKDKVYYDALVTRLYMDQIDKSKVLDRFKKIKQLWSDRDIVLVEGEKSRLGIGNDLFQNVKSIERILCPCKDAFSEYRKILDEVKKHDKSKLILIALGPTATVLAYDLATVGYQAVDIGHIDIEYEWFLQGVEEKCHIKNKYVGDID